ILDGLMQGLYARAQTNPLEARYYSCAPYLLGPGRAVQYTVRPRVTGRTGVPEHPSDNYLHEAMVATLNEREVTFDFTVPLQADRRRDVRVTSRRFWTGMFVAAALFNFVFGLPLWLAPAWSYALAYRPAVDADSIATHFLSDFGFAVVLIGVGYYLVSRDLGQ